MKKLRLFSLLAAAILPMTVLAQGTANVHGHVQNAAGVAIGNGQVKFSTEKTVEEKDRK